MIISDKNKLIEQININGLAYSMASDELKRDKEIINMALSKNGLVADHIPDDLKVEISIDNLINPRGFKLFLIHDYITVGCGTYKLSDLKKYFLSSDYNDALNTDDKTKNILDNFRTQDITKYESEKYKDMLLSSLEFYKDNEEIIKKYLTQIL